MLFFRHSAELPRDVSERLPRLFLGYSGLVRGYDPGSFESTECGIEPDGSCPAFDRLIGSKIALANAEMRVPLWSLFGGSGMTSVTGSPQAGGSGM